jgi:lactoylglutathione lyase
MGKAIYLNHATLIVNNLEQARAFYEQELGLEPLPTFNLDFPAQFYRINDNQQLHVSEWPDQASFRGHVCFQVDDFNSVFWRMRELGVIDTAPWGKVRRLPDGAMQMFVRDPAGNLLEISCHPNTPIDETIFNDDLVAPGVSVYVSERNDGRGERGEGATLYHSDNAQ